MKRLLKSMLPWMLACVFAEASAQAAGGPFNDFPGVECGLVLAHAGRNPADQPMGWWLHGFASGAIWIEPIDKRTLKSLRDVVDIAMDFCRINPDRLLSGDLMNQFFAEPQQ